MRVSGGPGLAPLLGSEERRGVTNASTSFVELKFLNLLGMVRKALHSVRWAIPGKLGNLGGTIIVELKAAGEVSVKDYIVLHEGNKVYQ